MVRLVAALSLPLIVPWAIVLILWALPGDPAGILCPPGICPETARAELASAWHLDGSPWDFYAAWLSAAVQGDFGRSWRVAQGIQVSELLWESAPATVWLLLLSLGPLLSGAAAAALGWMPRQLDTLWHGLGLVPSVILALLFAAVVQVNYGALSYDGVPGALRLVFGALTLGITDGALAGAILGTRSVFQEEHKRRYVQMATLRGESVLSNTLPNVLPALVGQLRSRLLHVLSGAVIVEVVLQLQGLGELLWDGTLLQDFGVVLAAAFGFALLSGALLLLQAVFEVAVALHVRRAPRVAA